MDPIFDIVRPLAGLFARLGEPTFWPLFWASSLVFWIYQYIDYRRWCIRQDLIIHRRRWTRRQHRPRIIIQSLEPPPLKNRRPPVKDGAAKNPYYGFGSGSILLDLSKFPHLNSRLYPRLHRRRRRGSLFPFLRPPFIIYSWGIAKWQGSALWLRQRRFESFYPNLDFVFLNLSSSRSGHHSFKMETRVRSPQGSVCTSLDGYSGL